jgi:hypothetical protein
MKFTDARRKHLAETLRTVALGQLAFFGYHAAQTSHYGGFAGSLLIGCVLELIALRTLTEGL